MEENGVTLHAINRHQELRDACNRFHRRYPDVWNLFNEIALVHARQGRHKYSGQLVFEEIRWKHRVAGGLTLPVQISNNHVAFYVRRWMTLHPEHPSFFRIREQTSLTAKATGQTWGERNVLTRAEEGE